MTPDLPPDPPGRWWPRLEAARRLGITERTLQRRMKQGRVRTRHDEHNRIQVYVPDGQDTGHDMEHDTAMTTPPTMDITPLLDRLLAQQYQIVTLQEALKRKTEEADRTHLQLKRVEEEQYQAQLAAATVPWWRGLWARLVGR